jgi:hypothetical protein
MIISGKLHGKASKTAYFFSLIVLWISVIGSFAADWIISRGWFITINGSLGSIVITVQTGFILAFIVISDAILVRIAFFMQKPSL